MATPINAAPRCSLTTFGKWVLQTEPKRPWDVAQYLIELWRLAAKVGYDPLVLAAQACVETGDATAGWQKPFQSDLWDQYLNPAGIGQTDSGPQNRLETDNPVVSAHAQVVHMGGYLEGPDGGWLLDTQYKVQDPRWDALKASGKMGTVKNVEDLGGGTWATDTQYAGNILACMGQFWSGDDAQPATTPAPQAGKNAPYILVVAGHQNTTGGNPAEVALTPFMAAELELEFRKAGYQCDWYQEIDGDGNPRYTEGNLDDVALGCARVLAARKEPMSVMIDCHYNGAHSPLHVIVPDVAGLTTAYADGAPGIDTWQNNPLDVRLAGEAAAQLTKAVGEPLFAGKLGVPGVMSETECGVGLEGYRLAMFAATARVRDKSVRLIFEAGGTSDPAAQQNDFTQRCAGAWLAALAAVFPAS